MDCDVARRTLNRHFNEFRDWSYEELASKIDETRRAHDCLHASQGRTTDGADYSIEINVFWDDKPGGNIRVIGDLSSQPTSFLGRLRGLLPVQTPDVVESFIMAPNGTFVDE